jgi:hypothetical protein
MARRRPARRRARRTVRGAQDSILQHLTALEVAGWQGACDARSFNKLAQGTIRAAWIDVRRPGRRRRRAILKQRRRFRLSEDYIHGPYGTYLFGSPAFLANADLSKGEDRLDFHLRNGDIPRRHLEDGHGRTRTAFALQAGIRRAGLRALPGGRHQPRPRRHLRGRPQHHRQLAAETARVRPVGETRPRPRRRCGGARPLFARRRPQLRVHPGRVQSGRAGGLAPDGASAARRQGSHLLAAQPPSPAMARRAQAAAGRGTALERPGRVVRAGPHCRRGRRCRTSLDGPRIRTRAVRAGAR